MGHHPIHDEHRAGGDDYLRSRKHTIADQALTHLLDDRSELPASLGVSGVFPLKVSIITAVHNGESEIIRTLDSVAAQDYRDIEHIIVDGDSRDATIPLVRQYGSRV